MSTELLIILQLGLVLLIAVIMMALIIRRQRQTIRKLQAILTDVKDDISGEGMCRHLQREMDSTTAHCRQETIALKPELEPEDMAISLRFIALQSELSLLQDHVGSGNTPWRETIKHYVELATLITDLIKARVDHATRTLNETHNKELALKDSDIQTLNDENAGQQKQLNALQPLKTAIEFAIKTDGSQREIEQEFHKALLAICENFDNTENLRELVFLMHEAFHENRSDTAAEVAPVAEAADSSTPAPSAVQEQNLDMLNNIINHQKHLIKKLRSKVDELENPSTRDTLLESMDALQTNIDQTNECMDSIHSEREFTPSSEFLFDDQEMNKVIEQFIEDSANMVEKIHLLSNENKQLILENEHIRSSLSDPDTAEAGAASSEQLKLKLEAQQNEMVALQQSFTELEQRYLALYAEKTPKT